MLRERDMHALGPDAAGLRTAGSAGACDLLDQREIEDTVLELGLEVDERGGVERDADARRALAERSVKSSSTAVCV
jgi:hypothetical protein